jgi:hypothetical protein
MVMAFLVICGRAARRAAPSRTRAPTTPNTATDAYFETASSTRTAHDDHGDGQCRQHRHPEGLDEALVDLAVDLVVAGGPLGPGPQHPDGHHRHEHTHPGVASRLGW